jgi:ParB family chromosome partitioning protein
MKRKALGKGLKALIPDAPPEPAPAPSSGKEIQMVKVEAVRPGRFQPRRKMDKNKIAQLAESVRRDGIINPLLVRSVDGGLELVAGERRLEAAKLVGLKQVPVMIRDLTDEKAAELALVENIQREELNPVEEAEAYQQLISRFGLKQEEVAGRVGKERATVANMLRLLKLPDPVKNHLRDGLISMGHGRALLAVRGEKEQVALCRKVIAEGLSVRAVEEAAARLGARQKPKKPKAGKPKKDPNVRAAEEEMTQRLHTRVEINGNDQKGRIEIHYYSADELDRLYQLLVRISG